MCSTPNLPAPAPTPKLEDPNDPIKAAFDQRNKNRQNSMLGFQSTVLTGPGGVMAPASTVAKTLVGV